MTGGSVATAMAVGGAEGLVDIGTIDRRFTISRVPLVNYLAKIA